VRVFVLCFDGLDHELVVELKLENLLQESHGTYLVPFERQYNTVMLWASFLTGMPAERHGITLEDRQPQARLPRNFPSLLTETKSICLYLPSINPHPEYWSDLHMRLMKVAIRGKLLSEFESAEYNLARRQLHEIKKRIFDDWELFICHFGFTDVMGHVYRGVREKIGQVYRFADEIAKELKELVGAGVIFLIVSDHGMSPIGRLGDHTKAAFFSVNRKVQIENVTTLDWHDIILYWLKEPIDYKQFVMQFNKNYFDGVTSNIDIYNFEFKKEHFQAILDRILKVAPNLKTMLDLGSGFGFLVKVAEEKGVECVGLDVSRYAIQKRVTNNMILGSATHLPFKPKVFDLTVGIELLEHIPASYLNQTIREIFRVTPKRAFFTICTATQKDYTDKDITHINIKPHYYWMEKLGRYYAVDHWKWMNYDVYLCKECEEMKVIAFDIDGTLEGYGGPIKREWLEILKHQPILVGLISSRKDTVKIARELGLHFALIGKWSSMNHINHILPLITDRTYIADSPKDREEAFKAGWKFIYARDFRP